MKAIYTNRCRQFQWFEEERFEKNGSYFACLQKGVNRSRKMENLKV